jgi:hypothetical protein
VGAVLRPRGAMLISVVTCAGIAGTAIGLPEAAPWLPGGALVLLSRVAASDPLTADALRAAGVGLGLAAVLLVGARVALERADL